MIMKTPFVTKAQVDEMIKKYPTPFHLYDEKGIRENARKLYQAFSWNKGFKEFFAVKATPNPTILRILKEEGCGTDCSSLTELMMSDKLGFTGDEIMFSSTIRTCQPYPGTPIAPTLSIFSTPRCTAPGPIDSDRP